MNLIIEIIKNEIKKRNHLPISEFMALAMYHPEHGYYIKKNPLGANADFTTAPEISQLFGEIIGIYLLNYIYQNINTGAIEANNKIQLIEIGAGKGTLAKDVLRVFAKFPEIYNKLDFSIIEVNEALIETQKNTLKDSDIKITWCKKIDDIAKNNAVKIIYANEFLDCLPIDQYIYNNKDWTQKVVALDKNNNLKFDSIAANLPEIEKILELKNLNQKYIKNGDILEYSNNSEIEFQKICNSLKASKGLFLTFDYGYFSAGLKDTLQSIKNHKYNNILENIGDADLTAYVDFGLLNNIAKKNGFKNIYNATQAEFLNQNNILLRAQKLCEGKTEAVKQNILNDLNRLIHRSEMGEIFKCLAISNI